MDVLRDAFTFISVAGVAFLGALIYLNNSKNLANINFLGVCCSLSIWILANFFADRNIQSLFWSRVAFTSITLGAFFFFEFACSFPTRKHISRLTNIAVMVLTVILVVIEQTDYFIPHTFISDGISNVDTGPSYLFFPIYILLVFGGGIYILIKGRKKLNDTMKSQTDIVIFGIVLMAVVGFVTNLILPIILGNDKLASIGTFSTLFFAAFTAYAMVRHRLFDIRAAVARSLGYVLVLGSMISIYAVGLFGVIDVVSRSANQETLRQILSIVLLVPLAISFQYIKNFFDKITNRLFYQESYDFQDVLNRVGKVVEAEIVLSKVLGGTRAVLSDALKSSFVEFLLIRDNQKSFSVNETKLEPYIGELNKHLGTQHSELLTLVELSPDSSLWKPFHDSGVAISLRLRTQKQVVGYILLGEKRNGGKYSAQDKHLLTIVASEIAVTVQNALRFEEIQRFNITLQQKIEEATKELRHTNKRLKLLDETKDDFISMASHQLRTPLTSVKGYISLVLDGDAGPIKPNQRKLLDQAYFSSQRMVFLIADLLNVSRLKTGKFIIEPTAVNLADLVSDEVRQLIETAQGRKLTLSYDKPSHFPIVDLDETKTRQVIMNFIDNAIYYTPAGGHISVLLNETQRSIELRVTDDGIGVPRDVQHHLFTKFFRASNAQKARPDGTGLGLFMAKKVIVAQGGAIIFTSQEGKGSTFGFTFPKTRHPVTDETPKTR